MIKHFVLIFANCKVKGKIINGEEHGARSLEVYIRIVTFKNHGRHI